MVSNGSPVLELLGKVRPQLANNPAPHEVAPHVYSFASLINTATRVYSYRYDEALRHLPSNALAMRRDTFVEALLQERFLPTSQRNWSIEVPDPADKFQALVSKTLTQAIRAIPYFSQMRYYLAEGAGWYGRYGSQLGLVQRRIGDRTMWTVLTHRPVNGDKIQYHWDGTPEVAINPQAATAYPADLVGQSDRGMRLLRLARPEHRRQFIMHRQFVDDADYFEPERGGAIHGVGLRSKIYWSWWLRGEMLAWAADFMQKVGTLGLLVFLYEEGNPKSKDQAEEAASKASTEAALTMAMPPGQNTKATNAVQHIPADAGGVQALQSLIQDYFERHMERLVVGQPSSGDTKGNGFGGSAGSALHADTKFQILKWDAGNLDETLTIDLVGMLADLNYGPLPFVPKFKSAVPNPEDAAKLQGVQTAYEMGVEFKTDEVRELTGMSKPEEGDDTIGGQEQLLAEAAAGAVGNPNQPGGIGGETEPGQGLTSNAKVERDTGSQWSPIAAYADDGSFFEAYVDGDPSQGESGGRWVTIGGVNGPDGKSQGGSPVFIRNGRIEKGHSSLVGKEIGSTGRGGHIPVDRTRANLLGGKADPFHVADLAGDIRDHHNAFAGSGGPKMSDDDAWGLAAKFATEQGLDRSDESDKSHKIKQVEDQIAALNEMLRQLKGEKAAARPAKKAPAPLEDGHRPLVDDIKRLSRAIEKLPFPIQGPDKPSPPEHGAFRQEVLGLVSKLRTLSKEQIRAIAASSEVEGIYPGDSKDKMLLRIENRLTAGIRAWERAQV